MDYQKTVAETIIVRADFSELLGATEAVESVLVEALQHGTGSVVEDLDLADCDRVAVELSAGGGIVFRRSYEVSTFTDARLVLYASADEAADMIDAESVDDDGNALELFETVAAVRIVGGASGYAYRIRFTATTSLGCLRVLVKTVEVIP